MIFLTGDTHGDFQRFSAQNFPQGVSLTKSDFVIILGEFAGVWDNSDSEQYWCNWLSNKPWTTLFVDGNHENFDLLERFPSKNFLGGDVKQIYNSIFWLRRANVYTIDGMDFFVMGGGKSHDKGMRTKGISWWPQEEPSPEEVELAHTTADRIKSVDYVLTHVSPFSLTSSYFNHGNSGLLDHTEILLDDLMKKLTYKKWYHAHLHLNSQIRRDMVCLYDRIIELGQNLDTRWD